MSVSFSGKLKSCAEFCSIVLELSDRKERLVSGIFVFNIFPQLYNPPVALSFL